MWSLLIIRAGNCVGNSAYSLMVHCDGCRRGGDRTSGRLLVAFCGSLYSRTSWTGGLLQSVAWQAFPTLCVHHFNASQIHRNENFLRLKIDNGGCHRSFETSSVSRYRRNCKLWLKMVTVALIWRLVGHVSCS